MGGGTRSSIGERHLERGVVSGPRDAEAKGQAAVGWPPVRGGGAVLNSTRDASIVARASARVQSQVAFRHSSRSRLLTDSTNAFCIGLPGWMNSSGTPRRCAHWSSNCPANAGPLSVSTVWMRYGTSFAGTFRNAAATMLVARRAMRAKASVEIRSPPPRATPEPRHDILRPNTSRRCRLPAVGRSRLGPCPDSLTCEDVPPNRPSAGVLDVDAPSKGVLPTRVASRVVHGAIVAHSPH